MVGRKSRKAQIRAENTRRIIAAAERVFAEKSYSGGTMQDIADLAELPKANVHYYFPTKEELYARVLEDILGEWIADAETFDTGSDPEAILRAYIRRKMIHSFTRPHASKVWAMEIIGRGRVFDDRLKKPFLKWNRHKVGQIRRWIDAGLLAPLDPQQLLYAIWAVTQHYADFEHQIRTVNRGRRPSPAAIEHAIENATELLMRGIMPRR